MKTKYLLLCLMVFGCIVSSCKKKAEDQAVDTITKMLVKNPWKVTKFIETSTNITTSFAGYECRFFENKTMTATNAGVTPNTVTTGTWNWDLNNLTFTATFSGASAPVNKINGTWFMTGSSTNSSSKTVSTFMRPNGSSTDVMELTEL